MTIKEAIGTIISNNEYIAIVDKPNWGGEKEGLLWSGKACGIPEQYLSMTKWRITALRDDDDSELIGIVLPNYDLPVLPAIELCKIEILNSLHNLKMDCCKILNWCAEAAEATTAVHTREDYDLLDAEFDRIKPILRCAEISPEPFMVWAVYDNVLKKLRKNS